MLPACAGDKLSVPWTVVLGPVPAATRLPPPFRETSSSPPSNRQRILRVPELPDLNAIAVVAALRESRCRNSDIPVILVSSNPAPVPKHLAIHAIVRRDPQLMPTLTRHVAETLARRGAAPHSA